jgi:hypothetical protein
VKIKATEAPRRCPGRGPPYWKSRVLRRHVLDDEEGGGRNGSRAGEVARSGSSKGGLRAQTESAPAHRPRARPSLSAGTQSGVAMPHKAQSAAPRGIHRAFGLACQLPLFHLHSDTFLKGAGAAG